MIETRVEAFVLLLMAACAVALLVKAVPVPYVSALALAGLLGGLLLGPGQLQLTHSLMVWSGLRGAIAVALALSLTERSSAFDSVRALVYGVVLLSILVQGTTIGPLARLLLKDGDPDPQKPEADRQGRLPGTPDPR